MLREKICPVISCWENIEDLFFMQDGAPPHIHAVPSRLEKLVVNVVTLIEFKVKLM